MVGRNVSSGVRDAEAVYGSPDQMDHSDGLGDDSQMNTSDPVGKLSVVEVQKAIDGTLIG